MPRKTQTKSSASNDKEKKAEKLEEKTQKMMKKISSTSGAAQAAAASAGAQSAPQTNSNDDEIKLLADWAKTLYGLHQELADMRKNHKLDTDEFKELALQINTDIRLCGMFLRDLDLKRKLLRTTW